MKKIYPLNSKITSLSTSSTFGLQKNDVDDSIELERATQQLNNMKKEVKLKEFCDTKKIVYRQESNRYYIVIDRKQITAKTREALIDKLFEKYFGESSRTLEDAFYEWMQWRQSIATCSKTLKENLNEWNNYIAKSDIIHKRVIDIDITDLETFLYEQTMEYQITSKRLSNIVTVINGVMSRCVSLKIIEHNLLNDVDKKPYHRRCKASQSNKSIYTLEDRAKILKYLEGNTDIYSLAISLSFYFCMRIGELTALKYSDVKNGTISIVRSKRLVQEMNDDFTFTARTFTNDSRIKGNKSSGYRDYPLMDNAKVLIEKIHRLYPDSEFLLMDGNRQLNGDRFNQKLKKVCEHLDIQYLSSHQIRFTVATLLYENNIPLTQLSALLGHANTATTWNYIRQQKATADTLAIMEKVLA